MVPAPAVQAPWNSGIELRGGEFFRLMANRMAVGYYRYGSLHSQTEGTYDYVAEALKRAAVFKNDGNGEHLVDAANLLMICFLRAGHPRFHMTATDDAPHHSVPVTGGD